MRVVYAECMNIKYAPTCKSIDAVVHTEQAINLYYHQQEMEHCLLPV